MSLPEPMAYGRTAEIYPWCEDMVLKLFYPWVSAERVEREARTTRMVKAMGFSAPCVRDVRQIGDRIGLEYERVEGRSMRDLLTSRPCMLMRFARRLAKLHVAMHGASAPADLPSQREQLVQKIVGATALATPLQQNTLRALANMPDGDRLCHGDFHPSNVLLHRKQAVVIDWGDATRGNPLADFTRTVILMEGFITQISVGRHPRTSFPERTAMRFFLRAYRRQYFAYRFKHQVTPAIEAQLRRWRPIVAAARMSEGISGLEEWLLQQVTCRRDSRDR